MSNLHTIVLNNHSLSSLFQFIALQKQLDTSLYVPIPRCQFITQVHISIPILPLHYTYNIHFSLFHFTHAYISLFPHHTYFPGLCHFTTRHLTQTFHSPLPLSLSLSLLPSLPSHFSTLDRGWWPLPCTVCPGRYPVYTYGGPGWLVLHPGNLQKVYSWIVSPFTLPH